MKTRRILAGVVGATMALSLAGAAFAQDLNQADQLPISADDPGFVQECSEGDLAALEDAGATVLWHFILTSPSAASGHMDASFEDETDSVTDYPDDAQGSEALHWTIYNNSMTLTDAETTDVTGGNFNLSHTCVAETQTATPTPTLPQTNTIDQTPSNGAGANLSIVFALILAVAGGIVAYAMRPRRVTNR